MRFTKSTRKTYEQLTKRNYVSS